MITDHAEGATTRSANQARTRWRNNWVWLIPVVWVLATFFYATLHHVTDTFDIFSILAILTVLAFGRSRVSITGLLPPAIVLLLSWFFSRGAYFSIAWFLALLTVMVMRDVLSDPTHLERGGRYLVRGTACLGLLGFADQYALHDMLFTHLVAPARVAISYGGGTTRYEGFFTQPNQAAMYLCVAFAVGLGLTRRHGIRRIDGVSIVVLGILLVLSLSRSAIIAGVVVLAVFQASGGWRRMVSSLMAGCLALTAMLYVSPVTQFFASVGSGDYQSNVARRLIYHGAVQAIGQSPIVGFGFGSVPNVLPYFVPIWYPGVPNPLEDAHDLFLTLSIWAGVPFAVLVLCLILWGCREIFSSGPGYPWGLGCAAIILCTLFDSPLTNLSTTSLYMTVVGSAVFAGRTEH